MSLAERLRALGRVITPDMITGTQGLYAPLHPPLDAHEVRVLRDLRYGPDERHRLDLFLPASVQAGAAPRGVLLFVHGGGFIMGDKSTPGRPFYDNVGRWALRHGLLGATMTYRLAPAHRWPSGSDDVDAAVQFLRRELPAHGGDPQRICVMGQSAGAVHVAGFLARAAARDAAALPASAVLVSGLYDTRTMEREMRFEAYFGTDARAADEMSFLHGLAGLELPLLALVAELDPPDFLRQGAVLLRACVEQRGAYPRFVQLAGHNHLSPVLALGSGPDTDTLGPVLAQFLPAQPSATR